MSLALLALAILALGALIGTKSVLAPAVILGVAQVVLLCRWVAVDRGRARRWRSLSYASSPLLLLGLLIGSSRVYPSILFPGLLLTAIALGLLGWSVARALVRRGGQEPIGAKPIVGLALALLALDFVASVVVMMAGGLGHSARAGQLVPWKWLLLFLWVVVVPVSLVILSDRYRLATGAGRRMVRVQSLAASGVILFGTLLALGRIGYWPPILYAARGRHADLERWLITSGADVNVTDRYDGWSPLTFAARWNDEGMVRVLLEHGARDVSQLEDHWPALGQASIHGHVAVVELLLPREENLERARDVALCFAARHGHAELVEYLLDSGARVDAVGHLGRTAFQEACEAGHVAAVSTLLRRKAALPPPESCGNVLINAAAQRDLAMVRLLLDHGVDVNSKTSWRATALLCAAAAGDPATVQLLLDRNADSAFKDASSKTALDIASEHGHTAVVELLRRASAAK